MDWSKHKVPMPCSRSWRPPLPYLNADLGQLQLLRKLEPHMKPTTLETLRGKTVAIDACTLLYKAALETNTYKHLALGLQTTEPVKYCMGMVNLLATVDAKPTFVFHGRSPKIAEWLVDDMNWHREQYLKWAIAWDFVDEDYASKYYIKSFSIKPCLAQLLIEELRICDDADFIVAPYDANAQLAYLLDKELVQAVITEDPFVVLFGSPEKAISGKVILKLDKDGNGREFQISTLFNLKSTDGTLDYAGFTKEKIQLACILSGCCYISHIYLFDIACIVIKEHPSFEAAMKVASVGRLIDYDEVGYARKVLLALQYQLVYDPNTNKMVHLSEIPVGGLGVDSLSLDFLCPYFPEELAKSIAMGELDPVTMQPVEVKRKNEGKRLKLEDNEVLDVENAYIKKRDELFYPGDIEEYVMINWQHYDGSDEEPYPW